VSVFLVASELIALRLYDRRHKLGAALLLAFAIAIKFYPAVFLLYFVLRRDGAFVSTCLGATIVLLVLPVAWIGWERAFEFQSVASKALLAAEDTWLRRDPNSQRRLVGDCASSAQRF
jgi:Glycosyltransferase family 87